ncbi:uncharacterized protein LOC128798718 [Vidua chalybeata]|uniref:uncharacterized protein LOC128798718 n=1 Tax=Vidua chalybeata TaxID=81927 RepID=UPI0023A8F49C|nr:uncharacterized protein LOC128798718 [Vidua chalybeata]
MTAYGFPMEKKSRICRASPASAASHRTPSRCRCPTSTPLRAGLPGAHTAGSAPGFLSRGTALPRRAGQSRRRRRSPERAPPPELCGAGSALLEPSRLVPGSLCGTNSNRNTPLRPGADGSAPSPHLLPGKAAAAAETTPPAPARPYLSAKGCIPPMVQAKAGTGEEGEASKNSQQDLKIKSPQQLQMYTLGGWLQDKMLGHNEHLMNSSVLIFGCCMTKARYLIVKHGNAEGPLQVLRGGNNISLVHFLLWAKQFHLSQPFLIAEVLQLSRLFLCLFSGPTATGSHLSYTKDLRAG